MSLNTLDITPTPRILRTLGEIPFQTWQCIAELVDNSIDAFLSNTGLEDREQRITVTWSSDSVGAADRTLEVSDNAAGMSIDQLQNAVRAGYTSNDPIGNLGLFGMGFNIATARLGEETTILSTRSGDADWVGVKIDFQKLIDSKKFDAPIIRKAKSNPEESGTRITISKLKTGILGELSNKESEIRQRLELIYTPLLSEHDITISFGLYQSLYGYLPGIDPDQFDVVIVDEAHHALAHGFRTCLEHLQPRFLVGMTATPWRGDGQSLTTIFGDPIAKVSLVDGMAMGYLSKVDYRILCDNVDWDNMQSVSEQNLSIRDLNKRLFLPQRDEAVISELKKTMREIDNPRVAIFSPSIEHSNRFADMLSAAGIPCAALSKVDKAERRRRLLAFASGTYRAVCAVDVMNEGIDIPDVNILVFLRATHSRRIFVQQLGRGLRLSEGKEKVIVLDFVSDIRRMAEMIEMNNEGKAKGAEHEVLYLREGFVSFSDARVERFVNVWLEDVADLSGSDDEVKLKFPEGF